jgi:hypothetical protein
MVGTTAIVFQQFAAPITYTAGTGLNESPAYTFNIANTTVSANTYGSASAVPVFAVNAQGQLTSVTNTNIAISGSAVSGAISGQAGSVANALTLGTYLTGTSFNGSAAVTATVDATSANTASKVVARDASGDFSAGTITAALSGNATTATTATNVAGGAANQIVYNTGSGTTAFATAPSATGQLLNWTGSAFAWTNTPSITSITLSGGTANGVTYLNGSKVLTSGSALVFDGTNLGVSVTPSTWSTGSALETNAKGNAIWGVGSSNINVLSNAYYNGGYLYASTGAASNYQQASGAHKWLNAASGTAGNAITFTQAMTLDASGNLAVGTTTAQITGAGRGNITLNGSSSAIINLSVGDVNKAQFYHGGTDMFIGNQANGYLMFQTNATERARITSAGNFGIGTTSPRTTLDVNGSAYIAGGGQLQITGSAGSTGLQLIGQDAAESTIGTMGSQPLVFRTASAEKARLTTAGGWAVGTTSDPGAGAIYATGAITAFFSDKRLKTVSGKIENALDKVGKLSGVYYTLNDTAKSFGYDSDEEQVGVLAQEVEAVLPQIVKPAPFDLDENNNSKSGENYKTVQYDKLVPLLIEAIKELEAKVAALEAKG